MKKKVIHIYYRAYDSYFPRMGIDSYYLAGWSGKIAQMTAQYTDHYVIENWRPETDVHTTHSRNVHGVTCRVFPAIYLNKIGYISPLMVQEMRRQMRDSEILMHFGSINDNFLNAFAFFVRDVPIAVHHHGGANPLYAFSRKKSVLSLCKYFVERNTLKNVDKFFVSVEDMKNFLLPIVGRNALSFGPVVGVDFARFKPMNKIRARKLTGISLNARVLLYVGKLYKLKGADLILKSYMELKKRFNIELIMVGGAQTDPLYKEALSCGARVCGHVSNNVINLYYNAADIFISIPFTDFGVRFLGTGIAPLESLACGTPVISTGLRHFPKHDLNGVGMVPKSPNVISECILQMLQNPKRYGKCRKITMKYYDWRIIIRRITDAYGELFKQYYGEGR